MMDGQLSCHIHAKQVPVFEEALRHADEFLLTAAGQRNRNFTGPFVQFEDIPFAMEEILFDPQTSGGLLISLAKEDAPALLGKLKASGLPAEIVGEVLAKSRTGNFSHKLIQECHRHSRTARCASCNA